MATLITAELFFSTEVSIFKTAYSESFSGRVMKTRIFILQIDNKIADAADASEKQKIQYSMSLLRGSAAEWTANYVISSKKEIFQIYITLRHNFWKDLQI